MFEGAEPRALSVQSIELLCNKVHWLGSEDIRERNTQHNMRIQQFSLAQFSSPVELKEIIFDVPLLRCFSQHT